MTWPSILSNQELWKVIVTGQKKVIVHGREKSIDYLL